MTIAIELLLGRMLPVIVFVLFCVFFKELKIKKPQASEYIYILHAAGTRKNRADMVYVFRTTLQKCLHYQ